MNTPFFIPKKYAHFILLGIALALYANTLFLDFALDDTMMLVKNKYTLNSWEGMKNIFTQDAFAGFLGEGKTLLPGGRYRPLSQAVFNLVYGIFGLNPFVFHLINVLLFALSGVMLYRILSQLFPSPQPGLIQIPFLVSLLYILHPIHTEVVANIKSLDLILSFILSFGTLYFALKYLQKKHIGFLLGMILSFFLALLAKENSITFLALIPFLLIIYKKEDWKKSLLLSLYLAAVAMLYLFIRQQITGDTSAQKVTELLNNPFLEANTGEKYATIFYTWIIYFKLLFWPQNLTHDYYPYVIELQSWKSFWPWISLLFFTTASLLSMRWFIRYLQNKTKFSWLAVGFAMYITVFSVSSNLLFNIGSFMNERFIYIADIGFFMAIAYGMVLLSKKIPKPFFIFILVGIVLGLSIKTISRNRAWKDDYTLFTTDVKVSYNSAKCNVSAGGKTYEKALEIKIPSTRKNMLLKAKTYLQRGLKIHPKYIQGWILMGNVNYELQDWKSALISYQNALGLSLNNDDILNNLRNLSIKASEHNSLDISYKALKILSTNHYKEANSSFLLATVFEKQNRMDSCHFYLQKALDLDSNYVDAWNKLGQIMGAYYQDFAKSEQYLFTAYQLDSKNYSVLQNIGVLYAMQNKFSLALKYFLASKQENPSNKQIYRNISITYGAMGNQKKALEYQKLYEK